MKKQWMAIIISCSLIAGSFVSIPGQAQASSDSQLSVVRSVNFRSAPTITSTNIRLLQVGETAILLDRVNAFWYKIKDRKGKVGYVSSNSKYVKLDTNETSQRISATVAARKVIAAGGNYLGTPYEFGSSRSNTKTFDCSDFVRQAYLDGIKLRLPPDSRTQGEYVKKKGNSITDWRKLKPGDIMFFMEYKGSKASNYQGVDKLSERITHNGIYIGNGMIIQTYSVKSGGVRIDTIEGSQWERRFLFGGSPL